MHYDIDDLSSKRKTLSPFEISSVIFNLYAKMSNYFMKKNSLSFFMGGDNFIVVASDEGKKDAKTFVELIKNEDEILLNCGIGTRKTAREAVSLATKSLDTIREIRDSGKEKPEVYELQC
jgi:GTP cyclohydrolase IIa